MKYFIAVVLLMAHVGCTPKPKEYLYPEAAALFRPGMSPQEVEAVYGKPQIVDSYTGDPSWTYIPKHLVEKAQPGELQGFIVEFKSDKATSIKSYTISIGRPYK